MTFTKDEIKRAKAYRIRMNSPSKVEPVEHNYHEDDAIAYLERWYDLWSKDEDWWGGSNNWDINIFNFEDDGHWTIGVCGLVKMSDDSIQTDTSNEIDLFELNI